VNRLGFLKGQIEVPDDFNSIGEQGDRSALRRRAVKLLLDAHLHLWATAQPERLSKKARALNEKDEHELFFSSGILWEIVIKRNLGRDDFKVDARVLRRALLDNGYSELPVASEHVVAIDGPPQHNKDRFDRVLVAQAIVEGITLLTSDPTVAKYGGSIALV
jgi:PIN domain nuclease of toxin-antitoxin system